MDDRPIRIVQSWVGDDGRTMDVTMVCDLQAAWSQMRVLSQSKLECLIEVSQWSPLTSQWIPLFQTRHVSSILFDFDRQDVQLHRKWVEGSGKTMVVHNRYREAWFNQPIDLATEVPPEVLRDMAAYLEGYSGYEEP